MAKIVKRKLKIEGMHCGACALLIDGDLEDKDGVESAQTNYAKSETELEYDEEKIKEKDILKTFEEIGYKATFEI